MNRLRLNPIEAVLVVILAMIGLNATAHAQVCPGKEDCLLPHESPGCNDLACCEAVCLADPFCCKSWDTSCVNVADATCVGLCGATASGSCCGVLASATRMKSTHIGSARVEPNSRPPSERG